MTRFRFPIHSGLACPELGEEVSLVEIVRVLDVFTAYATVIEVVELPSPPLPSPCLFFFSPFYLFPPPLPIWSSQQPGESPTL